MTPLRIALMLGGCWVIPMFISFLPIMQGWNNIGIIDLVSTSADPTGLLSDEVYLLGILNKQIISGWVAILRKILIVVGVTAVTTKKMQANILECLLYARKDAQTLHRILKTSFSHLVQMGKARLKRVK